MNPSAFESLDVLLKDPQRKNEKNQEKISQHFCWKYSLRINFVAKIATNVEKSNAMHFCTSPCKEMLLNPF